MISCLMLVTSFQARIRRDAQKISHEFQSVARSMKASDHRKPPRLNLLEVMCSEQSEFTKQVPRLGGKAYHFGRVQGHLSTAESRKKLFAIMIMVFQQPRHVYMDKSRKRPVVPMEPIQDEYIDLREIGSMSCNREPASYGKLH